jgi:1,4-dihydroxy-2-naphthoate octaprenyltransferase
LGTGWLTNKEIIMQAILKNWNLIRMIRLVAGIAVLGYGMSVVDWLLILIGFTLGIMAIFNTGCSPFSSTCEVDTEKKNE